MEQESGNNPSLAEKGSNAISGVQSTWNLLDKELSVYHILFLVIVCLEVFILSYCMFAQSTAAIS